MGTLINSHILAVTEDLAHCRSSTSLQSGRPFPSILGFRFLGPCDEAYSNWMFRFTCFVLCMHVAGQVCYRASFAESLSSNINPSVAEISHRSTSAGLDTCRGCPREGYRVGCSFCM